MLPEGWQWGSAHAPGDTFHPFCILSCRFDFHLGAMQLLRYQQPLRSLVCCCAGCDCHALVSAAAVCDIKEAEGCFRWLATVLRFAHVQGLAAIALELMSL